MVFFFCFFSSLRRVWKELDFCSSGKENVSKGEVLVCVTPLSMDLGGKGRRNGKGILAAVVDRKVGQCRYRFSRAHFIPGATRGSYQSKKKKRKEKEKEARLTSSTLG